MASRGLQLLLVSLLFHVVYLNSIFSVYFRSQVVDVPERFKVETADGERLAKRVVLIVGDGLRADKLFQTYPNPPFAASDPLPAPIFDQKHAVADNHTETTTPAPYIRSLIQTGDAQWGVSHTRVPTESRPGHVALIGGMYEDVSAVTRGWTTNPVPFDSVFNQSSHAFTFGSPDILPMFKLGASDPDRVQAFSYNEEAEDFTTDAVHLDLWVLDQLRQLLRNASSDPVLYAKLHEPGVVFFEHLLGLDTTGHSYRPHGPEYHRNIRVVDYVVEETVELLNEFYDNDGETAFVFTADHGMSTLGNHGDGHPDNTRTPLVAWGKGVRRRSDWEEPALHDGYSKGWGLAGVRRDVNQADIAVLMSVLAGVSIPANSAGRVPLDYLEATPSFRARAAFANAKQLLAEAGAKSNLKRQHAIAFRPYPELIDSPADGRLSPEAHRQRIDELLANGQYRLAEERSKALADIAIRASNYFQKYDWALLCTIVTLGYTGFMAYTALAIFANGASSAPTPPSSLLSLLPLVAFALLALRFAAERAPITYYLYAIFPTFFWHRVLRQIPAWLATLRQARSQRAVSLPRLAVDALAAILVVEAMAYGYSDRRAFTAIAYGMGMVWPVVMLEPRFKVEQEKLLQVWQAVMAVLGVFPLLPVEKGESLATIACGAAVIVALAFVAIRSLGTDSSPTWSTTKRFLLAEVCLTIFSTAITCSSANSLQRKQGLPVLNQYLGWAILIAASSMPLLHGRPRGQPFLERLSVLLFAFGPVFIILSLSYEAIFYAVYASALVIWMLVESALAAFEGGSKVARSELQLSHVRVGLFFLAFFNLGFFGCGNVASISSFYLEPVYRLMTIFAPFPMGALLLYKLLIPFVALAAVSSVINRRLHLPPLSLFLIGSFLSEILTITFFFRVTDTGSWLEIGSSITNFVICSLLGLFSSVLLAGGEYLLAHSVG
ncbi:PigN-domain-containing protein [Rhodotorula sp. JG-1b]|nr:PigN-domain-containing protein [Rhodotorula sp. JG-1b]